MVIYKNPFVLFSEFTQICLSSALICYTYTKLPEIILLYIAQNNSLDIGIRNTKKAILTSLLPLPRCERTNAISSPRLFSGSRNSRKVKPVAINFRISAQIFYTFIAGNVLFFLAKHSTRFRLAEELLFIMCKNIHNFYKHNQL